MIASFSVFLVIFSEILVFFVIARFLALIPDEIARNPVSFFSIALIAFIGFLAPKAGFFFFGDALKRITVSTVLGLVILALCLRIELSGLGCFYRLKAKEHKTSIMLIQTIMRFLTASAQY